MTVDEPMARARPDDAGTMDGSASEDEVEWAAGLGQVRAELEGELSRLVDEAVRHVDGVVRTAEEKGRAQLRAISDRRREVEAELEARQRELEAELEARRRSVDADLEARRRSFAAEMENRRREAEAALEARRREVEAEQAALSERVAAVQANIEAVEGEIAQARSQASAEAQEIVASARRRADAIVAGAEARAAEIIAEARATAAGGWPEEAGVEGRLRGLSQRVVRLLSEPDAPPAPTPPSAAPPVSRAAQLDAEPHDEPVTDETPTQVVGVAPAPTAQPEEIEEKASRREPDAASIGPDSDRALPWTGVTPAPEPAPEPAPIGQPRRSPEAVERPATHEEARPVAEAPASPAAPLPAAPIPPEEEPPIEGPGGRVTQTLIFQAVPNFQAALALERSLKAMSEVREVRVADFDERQLTFQVTHELGGQLARVLLAQRGSELELVDARGDRVEFIFRN